MARQVTLALVEGLMKDCGDAYEAPYQRDAMRHLCEAPLCILQQSRQTGKTWAVSRFLRACIVAGLRCGVAYPSLRQASRILLENTVEAMLRFETLHPGALKRTTRGVGLMQAWNNGGSLMALSMDEAARAGVQGYTKDILVLDESHEVREKTYAAVRPLADRALRDGHGHVILFGVGGPKESIIEVMKTKGYQHLRLDDETIEASCPKYASTFAQARLEYAPEYYDQYYRCLPVSAGSRLLFPLLPLANESLGQARLAFGIDVGKVHDSTVVTVCRLGASPVVGEVARNLYAYSEYRGDYVAQSIAIREYINSFYPMGGRPQGNIAIEVNGPGHGLYDMLINGGLPDVTPVTMTAKLKLYCWRNLQAGAHNGAFCVSHEAAYNTLSKLTYDVKPDGGIDWDHNDLFSSLLINSLVY